MKKHSIYGKIHPMLNHLFEFLSLQITVIVSVVVREHDADQILLTVIIFGH